MAEDFFRQIIKSTNGYHSLGYIARSQLNGRTRDPQDIPELEKAIATENGHSPRALSRLHFAAAAM
ncbi:hypothetical protein [Breoghania sp.]|uniref:hypothetical protein n=1 Tax=Breoghania sp. TaxID=2065378 RepID=UPI0026137939|nr:hypothetical protein [Breoghania sp.]MDJ0931552.1 hypothetical protein [Breoghania sp.]